MIAGTAMLTIVASSRAMNMPSETALRISHLRGWPLSRARSGAFTSDSRCRARLSVADRLESRADGWSVRRMFPRTSPAQPWSGRRRWRAASVAATRAASPPGTRRCRPTRAAGRPARVRAAKAGSHSAALTSTDVAPPMMAAMVSSATTRPADMTTSRSHCSASSMVCVLTRTPVPPSAEARIVSHSRALASASTPEVGSSRTSSSGSWERAATKARRRLKPSGRSRTSWSRTAASSVSRPGSKPALPPKAPAEKARFSLTVRSSQRPRPWGT